MADLRKAAEQALEALTYYRDECSGAEPSISLFHQKLEGAVASLQAALSQPAEGQEPVSECTRTAPARIWLQADINEAREDDPFEDDGVTWSAESVGGTEVEYVRADLVHSAAQPVQVPDDSAVAELAWLENWLYFASEYVGVECCGHGVRGECCGNPNPVGRNPSEVVEAMARRHRELNALLAAAPLPPAQTEPVNRRLLEALQFYEREAFDGYGRPIPEKAIAAIAEAEAQAAQPDYRSWYLEAIAACNDAGIFEMGAASAIRHLVSELAKAKAQPVGREALGEEQIARMLLELNAHAKAEGPTEMFTVIVRAIERAHGLTGEGV